MKICVINGSPKGDSGVTHQYARYLELSLPGHAWSWHFVGARIGHIARNPDAMEAILADVATANLVLWAYPLYHHLVSSQFKRFIELVEASGGAQAFQGKYAALLSTSIHYFDHTARNYLQAVCEDWGMQVAGAHCADMDDLTKPAARTQLARFGAGVVAAAAAHRRMPRLSCPFDRASLLVDYRPGPAAAPADLRGKRAVIVWDDETDLPAADGPAVPADRAATLAAMVERLRAAFTGGTVAVLRLGDLAMRGPCLGCCQCGLDNECAWDGKDGYRAAFERAVEPADVVVFAGSLHDRFLSWRFRQFFDRSFFRTHQPYLEGKQLAWLVEGPVAQEPNSRQIMEAYADVMRANLAGIVTTEAASSAELDDRLDGLAATIGESLASGYIAPQTSIGKMGHLVFRDAMWGRLRPVFQKDYRHYRKTGYFDFPQREWGRRLFNRVVWLVLMVPPLRRGFRGMIRTEMAAPHRKVVEAATKAGT
jgi:multimeric flavodoxin WrbA